VADDERIGARVGAAIVEIGGLETDLVVVEECEPDSPIEEGCVEDE
jgi:hypothetical protein